MSVDEFQTAYQKGKSCNTQIFTLRIITELAKKNKRPIFIAFVDLEKAFDRVRRVTMLNTLIKKGIGSKMANALKQLYSNTNVLLQETGTFTATRGIRQGASSSVYIFIIFINELFEHLRNLIHADDTILLDTNYAVLKSKIVSTFCFFKDIDQTPNLGKTKYMSMGNICNHPKEDMNINNTIIEYTSKEKHLCHYLTDDNVLKNSILQDIEERATKVMIKFRNFINNNKTITLATRLKVFQACFRAAILSNCEAWGPCISQRVHTLYHLGLKLA